MASLHPVSSPQPAMVQIFDSVLAADAANFDIQNIPATYKHLVLHAYLRTTEAVVLSAANIRFNNDSAANYHRQQIVSSNAVVAASENENQTSGVIVDVPGASATASYFGTSVTSIPNYAGTVGFKTCTSVGSAPVTSILYYTENWSSHWRSTSAIDRITVIPGGGNWLAGSRLTLYGLN